MKTAAAMFLALHPWWATIKHEARREHVDPYALAGIVWHESRGNPNGFFQERGGHCSIGLGGVFVKNCDPARVAALRNGPYNLRVSAKILSGSIRYCKAHRLERRCAAGERVFPGGGGANLYAGNTTRFAAELAKLRRDVRRAFR